MLFSAFVILFQIWLAGGDFHQSYTKPGEACCQWFIYRQPCFYVALKRFMLRLQATSAMGLSQSFNPAPATSRPLWVLFQKNAPGFFSGLFYGRNLLCW